MDEEIDQLALKIDTLIKGSSRLAEHNLQLSSQIKSLQAELQSLKGNMKDARERVAAALSRLPHGDDELLTSNASTRSQVDAALNPLK
jgi:predicted  nucleic acid-binding Zn-ribbon protein